MFKTKLRFLSLLIGLPLLASLLINFYVVHSGTAYILPDGKELSPLPAALILGANVYSDGRLSLPLRDRVEVGVELYKTGKVKKLLMSGDHGQEEYNEVQAMKNYALEKGVPEEDIFMDHAGFDTFDSMYRAKNVFELDEVVVVSQNFHLPRALYIGQELGMKAVGYPGKVDYPWYNRIQLREYLSRVKAFLDSEVWFAEAQYGGEKISITGDGRVTQD